MVEDVQLSKPKKMCGRRISTQTVVIDNAPTVTLWILASILLFNINWFYVVLFWIYVPVSVIWFWRFICTYCTHYDTGCCPCGYGSAAPKLFLFRDESKFKEAFNRNIAIVFPYWFVPLIAGGYLIYNAYPDIPSWLLIVFVLAMIDGFVLVPLVSKIVGCKKCPTRESCPWAKEGGRPRKHAF